MSLVIARAEHGTSSPHQLPAPAQNRRRISKPLDQWPGPVCLPGPVYHYDITHPSQPGFTWPSLSPRAMVLHGLNPFGGTVGLCSDM